MAIATGTAIDRYEIVSLLGAGAMGEVYRARDARLGRDVAIKVLPAQFSADSDRLRRFDIEARAAGGLNHPNIVAIHDLGTHEGMPYVVSELLEGHQLRDLLTGDPLPMRKTVEYSLQIARGLAAAHAKSIVHRDLKPENLFVTDDGQVKILDFGLAKLVHPETGDAPASDSLAATMTQAGMIMGTAGYMAPEQVRGEAADHRSDIFAFGCVLYEMAAGTRAFQRDTPVETMSAILKEEPARFPSALRRRAPWFVSLVLRCLEKRPGERFESARDLAFALEAAAARPDEDDTGASVTDRVALPETDFRRLTFQRGNILRARFTPDGHSIVFGGAWEGRSVETFWMHLGSPEARSIGVPGTDVFSISPTGELAVCLRRRHRTGFIASGTLARMPLGGMSSRPLLEGVDEADWGPDPNRIAIVREVEGITRLEYPIGNVLFETSGWVSHPRVARDGASVAFIHHEMPANDGGSVTVVDLEGHARVLSSDWGTIRGLAWSADGRDVWFTAHQEGAGRNLHAVSLDGALRTLLRVPGQLCIQDIHTDGRALVTHAMERQAIMVQTAGESRERDLSWLDWSLLRDITPDGNMILILESGEGGGPNLSTCIRPTDGSPAIRIGDGVGMQFSPDGNWVLAMRLDGPERRLMLLPTGVGEPRPVPVEGLQVASAAWLPDGTHIVVAGNEPDQPTRLYRVNVETGAHEPIGPEGPVSIHFEISPEGRFFAARQGDMPFKRHPIDGGEPLAIPGLGPHEDILPWTLDERSILVHTSGQYPARIERIDLETGERTPWREIAPPDPTGVYSMRGFRFTPDGKSYGYTFTVQLDDLYLVEGLK